MVSRTKELILDALNELLLLYPIEEITTLMITEKAGVGKSTFYRYFKDKFDVMSYNYDLILQESIRQSSDLKELLYFIMVQFQNMAPSQRKRMHQYKGANSMNEYMQSQSILFLEQLARNNRKGKGLTETERFQCSIIVGGISEVTPQLRIEKEDHAAYKRYAALLYDLFPDSVQALSFTDMI